MYRVMKKRKARASVAGIRDLIQECIRGDLLNQDVEVVTPGVLRGLCWEFISTPKYCEWIFYKNYKGGYKVEVYVYLTSGTRHKVLTTTNTELAIDFVWYRRWYYNFKDLLRGIRDGFNGKAKG